MKRAAAIILVTLLFFQLCGGPAWAATVGNFQGSGATVTASVQGQSQSGDSSDSDFFTKIINAVTGIGDKVEAVANFFTNFDPGKMVNDWIKNSVTGFIRPLFSWAENNMSKYPYIETTDPEFTWWTTLVVMGLILLLYSGMRLAGRVMRGQRTTGDIAVLFGLIAGMFTAIWVTNMLVLARNEVANIFLKWMVDSGWLSTYTTPVPGQFIVPDLVKSIVWVNQDNFSVILGVILGGAVMFIYEGIQFTVYGLWLVLVVGSPFFLAATGFAEDFTPLMSYIQGLVRTLIASILVAVGWGIQGYIYQNTLDTSLQIVTQAVAVILMVIVLWYFWGKFILTEIIGMLTRPVQTVKGNLSAKAGGGLEAAGKAASILGALTGKRGLAVAGHKAKTAGEVFRESGEDLQVQARQAPKQHNDVFSRAIQRTFSSGQEGSRGGTGRPQGGLGSFKHSYRAPYTQPPKMNRTEAGAGLSDRLDHVERRVIPDEIQQYFNDVPMPGGGTYVTYSGPLEEELSEQLKERGIRVKELKGHLAVDLVDGKMAKYLAAQNMKGKTPYWTDGENFVTVDPYGVTKTLDVAPRDGIPMGDWNKKKEADEEKASENKKGPGKKKDSEKKENPEKKSGQVD